MSGQENGQFSIGNALTGMAQMNQMGIQNAQTRQQMYQTNLDIQKTLAQRAAGQDFQKAIDPSTGQLNASKYNLLLSADPNAAYAAQGASHAGLQNTNTQLSNQQQIANQQKHLQWAGNLASAYSIDPPTAKQMQDDQIEGINAGLQTPSDAAAVLSQAPTNLPPDQQKAVWANHALRFNAAAGQIGQSLPIATPIDTGDGEVYGQGNSTLPGYTGPGTIVRRGLTPAQQVQTGSVSLPGGGTQVGTVAQLTNVVGGSVPQGSVTPPGGPPMTIAPAQGATQPAAVPLPNVDLGPGRINPATTPGPSATGLNIPAGTATIADNDAQYYTSALGNQQAAQSTQTALRNVLAAAPGAATGPLSQTVATVKQALDGAMQRSAPPELQQALSTARYQYKVMKTIEPLVAKDSHGMISPPSLMGPVAREFGNIAYNGGGKMGDLARIGQQFMKPPANSGTPERMMILNALGSGAGIGGVDMLRDPAQGAMALGGAAGIPVAAWFVNKGLNNEKVRNALLARVLGQTTGPSVNALTAGAAQPTGQFVQSAQQ